MNVALNTIRFNAQDYLELPDEMPRVELLDGRFVELTPAPSPRHQGVLLEIFHQIKKSVSRRDDVVVLGAPVDVRLDEWNVVQPDVVALIGPSRARIRERFIDGPPELTVEVLSPSTKARDLAEKRELYRLAGVVEYWIVDPDLRVLHVYRLQETKERRSFAVGERVRSPLLPDFDPDLAAVFAPFPAV